MSKQSDKAIFSVRKVTKKIIFEFFLDLLFFFKKIIRIKRISKCSLQEKRNIFIYICLISIKIIQEKPIKFFRNILK